MSLSGFPFNILLAVVLCMINTNIPSYIFIFSSSICCIGMFVVFYFNSLVIYKPKVLIKIWHFLFFYFDLIEIKVRCQSSFDSITYDIGFWKAFKTFWNRVRCVVINYSKKWSFFRQKSLLISQLLLFSRSTESANRGRILSVRQDEAKVTIRSTATYKS